MSGKSFSVKNAAAASIAFNPTIPVKDGVQYIDSTSVLSSPRLATVKHNIALATQSLASDRHYVQFQKTVFDANGKAFTASVGISIVIPRTVVSAGEVADLRAFAKDFLGTDTIWNGLVLGDY